MFLPTRTDDRLPPRRNVGEERESFEDTAIDDDAIVRAFISDDDFGLFFTCGSVYDISRLERNE